MMAKVLELITGKDDLERVADRGDLDRLNAYLKKRRLWIPMRPRRYFDAASLTQEELLQAMEESAQDVAGDSFEPWIFEIDEKTMLPAFSSQKRMETFVKKVSQELGKVFGLGCAEFLIKDIVEHTGVDVIGLNWCCERSWDIGVGDLRKNGEF